MGWVLLTWNCIEIEALEAGETCSINLSLLKNIVQCNKGESTYCIFLAFKLAIEVLNPIDFNASHVWIS